MNSLWRVLLSLLSAVSLPIGAARQASVWLWRALWKASTFLTPLTSMTMTQEMTRAPSHAPSLLTWSQSESGELDITPFGDLVSLRNFSGCDYAAPPCGHSMSCTSDRSVQHPEARGHLSEALTEDTGVGNSVAGSPLPLTTGNENLDVAIVVHLQYCNHLIQVILCFHLYKFLFIELHTIVWFPVSTTHINHRLKHIRVFCWYKMLFLYVWDVVVDLRRKAVAAQDIPAQTSNGNSPVGGAQWEKLWQTGQLHFSVGWWIYLRCFFSCFFHDIDGSMKNL